ncbi:hypothetical protein AJ87_07060 [Rhizobium yanglingense]|nr:hypothetical protein AJ87_07060 [Rhizobium yanglingense]
MRFNHAAPESFRSAALFMLALFACQFARAEDSERTISNPRLFPESAPAVISGGQILFVPPSTLPHERALI